MFEQKIGINSIVKPKKTATDKCNLLHRFSLSGTGGFGSKKDVENTEITGHLVIIEKC